MEKSTYYFSPELQHRLRRAAKRQNRSQAAIVRDAVERYLAAEADPLDELIGAFAGPADGKDAATVKRELRERWKDELAGGDRA